MTRPGPYKYATCLAGLVLLFYILHCSAFKSVERKSYTPQTFADMSEGELFQLNTSSPYLKIHMKNGNTFVLNKWQFDRAGRVCTGLGDLLDPARNVISQGEFVVGTDSVALFETNVIKRSGSATALTVFTGVTVAITAYCIANPKACFGSCPTFYLTDSDSLKPAAEGFSASIAPSLEAADIDKLWGDFSGRSELSLVMKNEAIETHAVRQADLLVAPRKKGNYVFADLKGRLWECQKPQKAALAFGPEGDCSVLLAQPDFEERYSLADSTNLAEKEVVELEFRINDEGRFGLILGCRQTLLSTYLLYQTLAYMGSDVGLWLARLERQRLKMSSNPVYDMLGGIEVLFQNEQGTWKPAGVVKEYGPLAIDYHLIPLGDLKAQKLRIRLQMTRGDWRIDFAGLTKLEQTVTPIELQPHLVIKDGGTDERALSLLKSGDDYLITMPGEEYTLQYDIPDSCESFDAFLHARGYYLEWIREEWMAEENPAQLSELFLMPSASLKRLAPEFKQVEAQMEDCFWRSRYAKPD